MEASRFLRVLVFNGQFSVESHFCKLEHSRITHHVELVATASTFSPRTSCAAFS